MPHLIQNPIAESDLNTIKHLKQESQEVSRFQAGDHKAAWNKQDSMPLNTNSKNDPQKKHRLGTVFKKITGGLNMFDGTNLTLISDVDHISS